MYEHIIERLVLSKMQGLRKLGIQPLSTGQYFFVFFSSLHSQTNTSSRVAENPPKEVLTKMHAPPKSNHPVITHGDMLQYEAFLLGEHLLATTQYNFFQSYSDLTQHQASQPGMATSLPME